MAIQVQPAAEEYIARKKPEIGASYTPPPPAPKPATSSLDTSVSSYLNKTAANLGTPGYMTEAGSLYADRVTQGLKTPDASSVNAQNTEDTAASRRQYMATLNAGEAIGQSGFAPGSAQATRIADQSQAGVNQANQAGQSAVNAYIRARTEDNMARARGLEADQQSQNQTNLANVQNQSDRVYGRGQDTLNRAERADETTYRRGRDAIGDTRYTDETMYGRTQDALNRAERADQTQYSRTQDTQARIDNLDQRSWEREQVLKGNDETAKRNLLNALPDGPAKNAVLQGLSNGSLNIATALAQVMNPDGSIKEEYRGKTPGQLGQEALKEQATLTLQTEAQANGTMFDPNTPEGVRAVAQKMMDMQKAKDAPIDNEAKARVLSEASERLANLEAGQAPDPEDIAALPSVTPQAIPQGSGTAAWLAASTTGGWVKINGKGYKVLGGDSYVTREGDWGKGDRHDDYVIMEDASGNPAYITDTGAIVKERPVKGWENTQE